LPARLNWASWPHFWPQFQRVPVRSKGLACHGEILPRSAKYIPYVDTFLQTLDCKYHTEDISDHRYYCWRGAELSWASHRPPRSAGHRPVAAGGYWSQNFLSASPTVKPARPRELSNRLSCENRGPDRRSGDGHSNVPDMWH